MAFRRLVVLIPIFETVEKAIFLYNDCSTLAGSEGDLATQVTFKKHQFIASREKLQKGTLVF